MKVTSLNCLAAKYPSLAAQWHPTKNELFTPYNVIGGKRKVWWKCSVADDHEWQAEIDKRTTSGTGCPYCAGRKVSLSNCLANRYPEIAKEWHHAKNEDLKPENISYGSNNKVWWKCPVADDHEWQATLAHRVSGKNCPCCANLKLVFSNCLANTYPEIAKEWHPTKNGSLTPFDIIAGSSKKVWWKAKCEHEWATKPVNRIWGKGCPFCRESKGEKKIVEILKNELLVFERQVKFQTCKNKKVLRFDFLVINNGNRYLIEYQGEHHYMTVGWGSHSTVNLKDKLNLIQKKDEIKKKWCEDHGIPLLIIPYWEYDCIEDIIENFLKIEVP